MTALHTPGIAAVGGLDLSVLCRKPVFTSHCRQESRQMLARELVDHDLRWRQGAVDTALFRAPVGRCDLLVLRYGAEVEIRTHPFNDFILMQMPLRGCASLECDGVTMQVKPGQLSVLAPQHEARLLWHSGCEQLIVKVPNSLLSPARQRLQDEGAGISDRLPPLYRLDGRQGARGMRLLAELLDELPGQNEQDNPLWRRHLEDSLSMFLLTHRPDETFPAERSPVERQTLRQLQKLEKLMTEQLTRTVSLQQLATQCGMSVRSLSNLCQRSYGQSPMERLRNLRLEAVRERLLQSRTLSVTEVALEYGFAHLGRFSGYYRERFGELPRHT